MKSVRGTNGNLLKHGQGRICYKYFQLRFVYFTLICTRGAERDEFGADEDELHHKRAFLSQKRAFTAKSVVLKARFQI